MNMYLCVYVRRHVSVCVYAYMHARMRVRTYLCVYMVGHGGSVVSSVPCVWSGVCSNPAVVLTYGSWASPSLAVSCRAAACKRPNFNACMYDYLYVCKYVSMYVCVYVCMHVCMHVCTCMHTCIYVYVCMHVCMY